MQAGRWSSQVLKLRPMQSRSASEVNAWRLDDSWKRRWRSSTSKWICAKHHQRTGQPREQERCDFSCLLRRRCRLPAQQLERTSAPSSLKALRLLRAVTNTRISVDKSDAALESARIHRSEFKVMPVKMKAIKQAKAKAIETTSQAKSMIRAKQPEKGQPRSFNASSVESVVSTACSHDNRDAVPPTGVVTSVHSVPGYVPRFAASKETLLLRQRAKRSTLRWVFATTGLYDQPPRLYRMPDDGVHESATEENKIARLVIPVRLNLVMQVATGTRSKQPSNARLARYLYEVVIPTKYVELRAKESWHQMFICDPPPTKARIDIRWTVKTGVCGSVVREVRNSHGITFADMLEAALHYRDDISGGGYWADMETKGNYQSVTLNDRLDSLERKYQRRGTSLAHSAVSHQALRYGRSIPSRVGRN
nr:hypothetical protein CFP56_10427 [Quercus suber]